jgi:hypothetical protein
MALPQSMFVGEEEGASKSTSSWTGDGVCVVTTAK